MKKTKTITTILITGGLGFIGTHLTLTLLKRNYKVIVFDNFSNSNHSLTTIKDDNLKIIKGDIVDSRQIIRKLDRLKIDIIIHLAAVHYIPYCDKNPEKTINTNLRGVLNMLHFAEGKGINKFIFTSTADIYKNMTRPCSEEDAAVNKTQYAITKILGEQAIRLYAAQGKLSFCILRLFNVYGEGDRTPHFIPSMIRQVKKGRLIKSGNINTVRDYIYIDDVIAAFKLVINRRTLPNAVYNIGSGHGYSGKKIIDIIKKIIRRDIILLKNKKLFRPIDRRVLVANIKLFSNTYSWRPKVKINEGLRRMLERR